LKRENQFAMGRPDMSSTAIGAHSNPFESWHHFLGNSFAFFSAIESNGIKIDVLSEGTVFSENYCEVAGATQTIIAPPDRQVFLKN
jgi:hypothetical protein